LKDLSTHPNKHPNANPPILYIDIKAYIDETKIPNQPTVRANSETILQNMRSIGSSFALLRATLPAFTAKMLNPSWSRQAINQIVSETISMVEST
jgi:hypothetical protein